MQSSRVKQSRAPTATVALQLEHVIRPGWQPVAIAAEADRAQYHQARRLDARLVLPPAHPNQTFASSAGGRPGINGDRRAVELPPLRHGSDAGADRIASACGRPKRICVDYEPELISKELDLWAWLHGVDAGLRVLGRRLKQLNGVLYSCSSLEMEAPMAASRSLIAYTQ